MSKKPQKPTPVLTEPPTEGDALDRACAELLNWVANIDPTWRTKLQARMQERGDTAREMFGAYVGYILEHDLHMEVPQHALFRKGAPLTPEQSECAYCRERFRPDWPGQVYCRRQGNRCAEGARGLQQPMPIPPVGEQPFEEPDPASLLD